MNKLLAQQIREIEYKIEELHELHTRVMYDRRQHDTPELQAEDVRLTNELYDLENEQEALEELKDDYEAFHDMEEANSFRALGLSQSDFV